MVPLPIYLSLTQLTLGTYLFTQGLWSDGIGRFLSIIIGFSLIVIEILDTFGPK